MNHLITSIILSVWLLPLAAQEPLAPPQDPFQEIEDDSMKTTQLRLALKQAAGTRVLGMGRTQSGGARAILAIEGKRHTLVSVGDTFLLAAAQGAPVEFTVVSITRRGVLVALPNGTQTLLD